MPRLPLLFAAAALLQIPAVHADYPYDDNPPFASEGRRDGVVVAVIDSGVDYLHPELKDEIWRNPNEALNGKDDDGNGYVDDVHGWDFGGDDAYPFDVMSKPVAKSNCQESGFMCKVLGRIGYYGQVLIELLVPGAAGHGTHIAGIVKEASAGTAAILPLRIDYRTSTLQWARQVTEAIEYAGRMGARVVNMSFGTFLEELTRDELVEMKKMIEAISSQRGILMVIAAGNENTDMASTGRVIAPGGLNERHVMTVGAVDEKGNLAEFSNVGEGIVDVYAPGVDILSAWPGGGTVEASGTSMATPFIAGLAARLVSSEPRARAPEVASRIRELAEDMKTGFSDLEVRQSREVEIPVILRDDAESGF